MSSEVSDDQIEIINEFLQESRDMLDHLEPTIIQLGQSCQNVDCWSALECTDTGCPRHGQHLDLPCWLDSGYLGEGTQRCIFASNEQECRSCSVFTLINGDGETMNAIFRLFHSMKGSAGFLELENISHVAHAAESLLDLIRSGKIRMEADHVDLLCRSCDFARSAMDYVESNFHDQGMAEDAEAMTCQLKEMAEQAQAKVAYALESARKTPPPSPAAEEVASDLNMVISPEMIERFLQEGEELLQNAEEKLLEWSQDPENQENVPSIFRDIHSFKGNCGFLGFGELERLSHAMETVMDAVKSGELPLSVDIPEELLKRIDVLRESLTSIPQGGQGQVDRLEENLTSLQTLLEPSDLSSPSAPETKGDREAVPAPAAPAEPAPAAEPPRQTVKPAPAAKAPAPAKAAPSSKSSAKTAAKRQDIRVDLDKLDHLINLIGEMVIAENMLIHNPDLQGMELENFNRSAQQMSKIVRELQELAMTIRMVPVSGLFRRMIRLVHDLSMKFGKKIELKLNGEDTELDKTVIETITDPLVHLLRNSLDHGLESPDERKEAGKPEKGTIVLSARHEEGEVWITIEDDGRGLNREKILAKAIANGIVEGDGSDLSDKAVANLIFQPGFSTAEKVTDVSGRGVGMDVVKQNLEKIKGKIEVSSRPGKGTRIDLRIPLTLGIIDGMMVRVGDTKCIVPTLAIREAFRPACEAITMTHAGQELVRVRENFHSVIRLHEILQKEPDSKELADGILILMEYQDYSSALFVDEILGQQQTVIKGLSDYIGNVRWVSGCTILGDGEVCLILDVGSLIESVQSSDAAS